MDDQPTISTHVLDTQTGMPARGVNVTLYRLTAHGEREVGSGATDDDGRIRRLLPTELETGEYAIEFALDGAFFSTVVLEFRVDDLTRSYHVPLLAAPYSIASYRGS
jgi:5-hydroxyisourate hydrolase